jgi:hypothetical protein
VSASRCVPTTQMCGVYKIPGVIDGCSVRRICVSLHKRRWCLVTKRGERQIHQVLHPVRCCTARAKTHERRRGYADVYDNARLCTDAYSTEKCGEAQWRGASQTSGPPRRRARGPPRRPLRRALQIADECQQQQRLTPLLHSHPHHT